MPQIEIGGKIRGVLRRRVPNHIHQNHDRSVRNVLIVNQLGDMYECDCE